MRSGGAAASDIRSGGCSAAVATTTHPALWQWDVYQIEFVPVNQRPNQIVNDFRIGRCQGSSAHSIATHDTSKFQSDQNSLNRAHTRPDRSHTFRYWLESTRAVWPRVKAAVPCPDAVMSRGGRGKQPNV